MNAYIIRNTSAYIQKNTSESYNNKIERNTVRYFLVYLLDIKKITFYLVLLNIISVIFLATEAFIFFIKFALFPTLLIFIEGIGVHNHNLRFIRLLHIQMNNITQEQSLHTDTLCFFPNF